MATRTRKKDTWDERWCLVTCRPEHRTKKAISEQCPHAKAPGQYVVQSRGEWCIFDPPTRMQANSWANSKPEREARIMWLCHECGEIMPLGKYNPEAQRIRDELAKRESSAGGRQTMSIPNGWHDVGTPGEVIRTRIFVKDGQPEKVETTRYDLDAALDAAAQFFGEPLERITPWLTDDGRNPEDTNTGDHSLVTCKVCTAASLHGDHERDSVRGGAS